jgi:hypothetical protein
MLYNVARYNEHREGDRPKLSVCGYTTVGIYYIEDSSTVSYSWFAAQNGLKK